MKQLREEIVAIVGGIDWMPETVLKSSVDSILKAIDDRLPEKKGIPSEGPLDRVGWAVYDKALGYNQAVEDIKRLLNE